jgi:hypothetical protein
MSLEFGEQMFLHGFQQVLRDAASVPFRVNSHPAQVALRGRDRAAADGSEDVAFGADCNQDGHGCKTMK